MKLTIDFRDKTESFKSEAISLEEKEVLLKRLGELARDLYYEKGYCHSVIFKYCKN